MPATSWRGSPPMSMVNTTKRSALGCGAAAVMVATRSSMVRKSSMEIMAMVAGLARIAAAGSRTPGSVRGPILHAVAAHTVQLHLAPGQAEPEAARDLRLQGLDAVLLELD